MASELKRNNETAAMVFMVDTYPWFPRAWPKYSQFVSEGGEETLKSAEEILVIILPSLPFLVHYLFPFVYILYINFEHLSDVKRKSIALAVCWAQYEVFRRWTQMPTMVTVIELHFNIT